MGRENPWAYGIVSWKVKIKKEIAIILRAHTKISANYYMNNSEFGPGLLLLEILTSRPRGVA